MEKKVCWAMFYMGVMEHDKPMLERVYLDRPSAMAALRRHFQAGWDYELEEVELRDSEEKVDDGPV